MNIIVSKVYDKQRFAWFTHLKYGYPLSYTKTLAKWIDEDHKYSFSNLTEDEVRYLQATSSCRYDSEYICKLKIITTKMPQERKRNIPPFIGTTEQYEQPQPKTFIVSWPTSNGQHREEYTDEEFERFIKIAVLRNKDIQNFNVRKI